MVIQHHSKDGVQTLLTVPEVVRMARRVRARCPNDVRAREETTSGAVVVLAKGDVTDRTGDDDL